MVIIWGSRLYGKVDSVPGLFHVETKFGHFDYFPLIPLGTYVVLEKKGDAWTGVKIPLSYRSVVLAWLRVALLYGGIFGLIVTAAYSDKGQQWVMPAASAAACFSAYALLKHSVWFTRAGYRRACELADMIGLTPEARQRLDLAYGYRDGVKDPFAEFEAVA